MDRIYTVDNSQSFASVWAQYPSWISNTRRLRLPNAPIVARKRGTTEWWVYDRLDEIWKPLSYDENGELIYYV